LNYRSLIMAVYFGGVSIFRTILEIRSSTDVRFSDASLLTPLFMACYAPHRAVVDVLLKRNAVVNLSVTGGWTPLMAAASQGDVELVKTLLNHNVDVASRTSSNTSALDLAERQRSSSIAFLLWKHSLTNFFQDLSAGTQGQTGFVVVIASYL